MNFDPPRRHSAAHIASELYHRCRNLGIEAWMDYLVRNPLEGKRMAGRKTRITMAVIRDNRIVCFVWVRKSYNAARHISGKRHRLDHTEIPLVIVRGMKRVPKAMEEIKTFYKAASSDAVVAEPSGAIPEFDDTVSFVED